ncbi:MAG TPA: DUF4010 domain-containing protein [Luteibacter sp.]|uniref:MgtC/SapB family protein n=1 Tax=Luteibacter sp. TaxID=1886636 RepID=UPI002CD900F2|nr:DUF4010 domain-containing protein [Luteibacter sp.]HVI56004.1 DUF4010 domain-containing protein [Luteibacter sp.]
MPGSAIPPQVIDVSSHIVGLGVALAVGLLVGLERERSKRHEHLGALAGIRTFALLGLTGATAQLIGETGVYVAAFFLTLVAAAALVRGRGEELGMTAPLAMLMTFLIGVLAISSPPLAAGLGVALALILTHRGQLHRFSRQWLSQQELHDLLILAGAAFVILPLVPDRTIDPWASLNPRRLWALVVAVMAVASAGHVAVRAFGTRYGLSVAGLAGGFASSTATVVVMGGRVRDAPATAPAAAGAAVMSNVGTIVQLAIVIGSLSPAFLVRMSIPLIVAGGTAIVSAVLVSWRSWRTIGDVRSLGSARPFDPWEVIRFVGMLGGMVMLTAIIGQYAGARSVPWLMIPAGLADVHAAAASVAQSVAGGQLDVPLASWCVLLAFTVSTVFKSILAALKGGRAYAMRVVPCFTVVVGAFALALLLTP